LNNKYRSLASNIFVFATGDVLARLIMFFLMPLYTSLLTPGQYGVAELLHNVGELLFPVAILCLDMAVFRFCIDENSDRKQLLSSSLFLISKIFIGVLIVAGLFQTLIYYQYTWYLVFIVFAIALQRLFAQFARGTGLMRTFAFSGIIKALALCGFNVLFIVFLGWRIEGYLLSIILANVTSALFIAVVARIPKYISFSKQDKTILKNMLIFSLPLIFNTISWWMISISNRYVLMWFHGAAIAGLFTAAGKLSSIINLLSSTFNKAWQFSSSKEVDSKDKSSFFNNIFKVYSSAILFATSALVFASPLVSRFILRNEFYQGWIYVPLLLLATALNCYSSFFGSVYVAVKKSKMAMVSTLIGTISSVIVCLATIPFIGVYGALIASCVSTFIIVLIRIFDTKKYITININWPITGMCFLLLTIQGIIMTFGTNTAIAISGLLFVIMTITILIYLRKEIKHSFKLIGRIKAKFLN